MQFPESWLRTMVDPALTTEALGHLLTMSGLEVEAIDPVAPAFSRVVVGRVLAVERHPNADKLTVCKVDAGQGSPLAIVCGAPNVAAGMTVPCALVGAELPGIVDQADRGARRRVERDAVLGARARTVRRSLGAARAAGRRAGGARRARDPGARGQGAHDQADAEPRRLPLGAGGRPGGRGADRDEAHAAGHDGHPREERREIPGEDLRSVRLRPLRGSRDPRT